MTAQSRYISLTASQSRLARLEAQNAALVAALEGFLAALKGNSSDLAEAAFEAKRALAAAKE